MPAARTACPVAFALVNLDRANMIETGRFGCSTSAMIRAILLRKGDGQLRDVVGLDASGAAWTIEFAPAGDRHATTAKPSLYRLVSRVTPRLSVVK